MPKRPGTKGRDTVREIVVGSRGSRLALAQAEWVLARLREQGVAARLEIVRTEGDRLQTEPLPAIGGEGVFVKEIQAALRAGSVDLAVHSLKDLPTGETEGLAIAAVPERADPRDLLVADAPSTLQSLPHGARVGTGSPRRVAQARRIRPDLEFVPIRGNVDTRIEKRRRGECDALILAAAGIERLGVAVEGTPIPPGEMLPAVGQGALAIEARAADQEVHAAVAFLRHPATTAAVAAERAFLAALGGGCRAPIGALAEVAAGRLRLRGLVIDPQGDRVEAGERAGEISAAAEIGRALAADLLDRGAVDLLARLRAAPFGSA